MYKLITLSLFLVIGIVLLINIGSPQVGGSNLESVSYPIPYGNYNYTAQDGYVNVTRNSEHFADIGLAFNFRVGINNHIFNPNSFNWTVRSEGNGNFNVSNGNAAIPITANYNLTNRGLKIAHNVRNNFGLLRNTEFWYYIKLDSSKDFVWNNTKYNSNDGVNIEGDLTNIKPLIAFYEGFTWDYEDLLRTGFKPIRFYVGNGSVINTDDPNIVAIVIQKTGNPQISLGNSIILDPTAVSGCTETSTTIECHSGTFTGNAIDTQKNISILNAYLPGEVGGANQNDIILNSTGGWINITGSTLEANATGFSGFDAISRFQIRNAPQNVYITNSKLLSGVVPSSNGNDDHSIMSIDILGNLILSGSRIHARGGEVSADCAGCSGGDASLTIITPNVSSIGLGSSLLIIGGNIDGGGSSTNLDGGNALLEAYGNWTTTNSHLNITVIGGHSQNTGARNGGSAELDFYSNYISLNSTMLVNAGDGATEGSTIIRIQNQTFPQVVVNLRGGSLSTTGNPGDSTETIHINVRDFILEDFNVDVQWEGTSYFNLTHDIAKFALLGTSRFTNAVSGFSYKGGFGIVVVGSNVTNLGLGSQLYEIRSNDANLYAPLTNLTSPANRTSISRTGTFTAQTITNATLSNSTLYVWNSTGSLINNTDVQTLSGQGSSISINHNFGNGQDAHNNYTWNILVKDTNNLQSFQRRFNMTVNVDFDAPNISLTNLLTTPGSQTATFNLSAQGQQGCFYSIYDASGQVSGLNNNITVTCGTTISATAGGFGEFQLFGYTNDSVGNINSTNQNYSLISLAGGPSAGASAPIIKIIGQTVNWTLRTDTGQSSYDLLMNKGSNRTRGVQFINDANSQVQIELSCIGAYCPIVSFENTEITLPSTSVNKVTEVDFTIALPEEIDVEEFTFIISTKDQEGNLGELPVRVSVTPLGSITNFFDRLLAVKRILGLDIPYLILGLLGSGFIFGASYFIVFKGVKTKGTRGFISIFPTVLGFILIIIFIR